MDHALKQIAITVAILASIASARAQPTEDGVKYPIPDWTLSPDQRYGVTVPIFDSEAEDNAENRLVEVRTGRVLAVIKQAFGPGYDRALNFHETIPPRWSTDGRFVLWRVAGKWFPDALVLLRIEKGKVQWQLDLLRTAQQAILTRTKKAVPERYAAAKKENAGNGAAYPDGMTVYVMQADETSPDGKPQDADSSQPLVIPLKVAVGLAANPKGIEDYASNVESEMDAVVDEKGKFTVLKFQITPRKEW